MRVLWFILAVLTVVTWWALLVAVVASWIPTHKEWKRFDGLRPVVAKVRETGDRVAAWILRPLRPVPLLVPIGVKAEKTDAAWRRAAAWVRPGKPVSQKKAEELAADPLREQEAEDLNRKKVVDFRYAVPIMGLFLAAVWLGVDGWLAVIRW
jgi:hypothetical protein